MYIIQNAFRNIMRNKGRNILIGASIFIIIIATVVALMINDTTSGIIDDYKERFSAEIGLVPNMEKMREKAMAEQSSGGRVRVAPPVIPPEQYVEFGESDYLQESVYTSSVNVNSDDITVVDEELGGGRDRVRFGTGEEQTFFMMKLLGNKFGEFAEGLREIAEGRAPENENEAVVSTDLAELNDFSIGDTITFSSELTDTEGNITDIYYELTIVGTYYDATEEYPNGVQQNALNNRRNEVLTSYETVVTVMQTGLSGIHINATFYLENPDMLDAFAEELYAKGLDEIYDVTTDTENYNKIVGPVEGLKSISITFMVIVLIFGGIIISLLSSIAIRERKYEIGVLRAMGMKKYKVALGLWLEMLLITCLCLVLGIGVGTLVAQPVTNVLLEHQIEAVESTSSPVGGPGMIANGMGMMGGQSSPDVEPLKNIDISLSFDTMLQVIGIALLLASLAGLVSIRKITKYEPIKILMERN